MNNSLKPISRSLLAASALSLLAAYFTPLWQILMWAPQYPEGLGIKIWIDNITGDVKIINALNHYIGMRSIEVAMFPEFGFMIYLVAFLIFTGLAAAWVNKRWSLAVFLVLLTVAGIAVLYDFYRWGYDYGHNLNPEAAIQVPGMSYQPPLLGTKQLLNFTAFSGPDTGGWVFILAGTLVLLVFLAEAFYFKKKPA